MKHHRYVDHQRLHIVTKDVTSLSISVLLLFRHYISHKITFGAPSSGGVLRSACGAFIDHKTLTLQMDHAKLLDVLTSPPVSRSILPCAVYFATSGPAKPCDMYFIDSSGYASRPIRRCLFIDYIMIYLIFLRKLRKVVKFVICCSHDWRFKG